MPQTKEQKRVAERKKRQADMKEMKKIINKKKQAKVKKAIKKKVGKDVASVIDLFIPTKVNINREIKKLQKQIKRDIGKKDIIPIVFEIEGLRLQLSKL